jgi:uncharacterized protein YidB (DUF937 family)
MDDLGALLGGLGGAQGSDPTAAVGGLTQAIAQGGGLDGLIGKLREGGLGEQVDTWVSTGPNAPVDPNQLGQALGPDTVQQLAAGSGIDLAALLPMLAMFLPQIIDMLTPNGSTPAGGLDSAAGSGGMPDLGGLLGGVLGGQAAGGSGGGSGGAAGLDDLLRGLGGPSGGDKGR